VKQRLIDPTLFPTADFWHATPTTGRTPPGFKEWSHYSLLASDFDLLINFSLATGVGEGTQVAQTPRLTLLFAAADGSWDGDVEPFEINETSIAAGQLEASLGRNSSRFLEGRYCVEACLPSRGIKAALNFQPITRPVIANNVRLSNTESVRWMVVPHLRASGEVAGAGRRYIVADAPAYHDRNWGRFTWGGGYAWEWAAILPSVAANPWCLVYSRITDRLRGATLSQSLILWRHEFPYRKFYGRDLSIVHVDLLRRERFLRIPRVAAVLLPGATADVPSRIEISASAWGDQITVRMSLKDFAQVIVPNDRWPGFTSLSEIRGRAEVAGRVGGQQIAFEARVQAELNHAPG
jgi:hypothetical protein